jgi:hypothetical protein
MQFSKFTFPCRTLGGRYLQMQNQGARREEVDLAANGAESPTADLGKTISQGHYPMLEGRGTFAMKQPTANHINNENGFMPTFPGAAVLLSGGIDSTTALAMARQQGFVIHALTFCYEQRHAAEQAPRRNRKPGARQLFAIPACLTVILRVIFVNNTTWQDTTEPLRAGSLLPRHLQDA